MPLVKSFEQFSDEVYPDEDLAVLLLINPHYNKSITDLFDKYKNKIFFNPFDNDK